MGRCVLPCWTLAVCIVIAFLGTVDCLPANSDLSYQSTGNTIPGGETREPFEDFDNTKEHDLIWKQEQPISEPKHNYDAFERFETAQTAPFLGSGTNTGNCGDGLCHCIKDDAICSNHPDGIPYVPRLPENITFLDLSNNRIHNITDDFFANVTAVQAVSLSDNHLQYISQGSFRVFENLQSVNMSNMGHLQYNALANVVSTSTIHNLTLPHAGLFGPPPPGFFDNLPNLDTLILVGNSLNEIKLSLFNVSRNLTALNLDKSDISYLTVDAVMDSLVYLNITNNGLSVFPTTCQESSDESFFPTLVMLRLSTNHISSIPELVCLPKLQILDLEHNKLSVILTNAFSSTKFSSLQELSLNSMIHHLDSIQAYALNNTSLKRIDLVHNNLRFYDNHAIHADAFANCTSLNDLRLSWNFMDGVSAERFLQLFGHLDQLIDLHIESCQLNEITREMLSPFRKVEYVILNRNSLKQLADGTFDDLLELEYLDLDSNQLSVVSPNLLSPSIRQNLKKLDLSGNPFECSCSVLWLRDWMISQPSLFQSKWGQYNCSNIPGLGVMDLVMSPQACLFSHTAYVIIAVVSGLAIAAYTSFVLAYRYRWHFRLILFEAFRGTGDARRRHLARNDFDFDLFVCYESEDLPWVRQHLMPQMEDRLGLKLCVHQRDFIVGKYISENISDCVDKSKKVMMLFSTHFAQSQWCQFELALCLRHVMDHDDDLIIVCLDDVSSRDITGTMMAVLKTTTYIQWEENNEDAVGAFWGRLNIALQEIIPRRPAV